MLVRFVALLARGRARFDAGSFRLALLLACSLTLLAAARALAEPPQLQRTDRKLVLAPNASTTASARPPGGIPPALRAALKRIGGARAVRVAQGVRAGGRVALRPMFWVTRDHRGAMFALGGAF